MLPPRVRLVVLNYNGGALLERCVQHLEALSWPEDRLEIVVIDNCSSDGSDIAVEQGHRRVRLLRSPRNAGFPANNLALSDLDSVDYVGLVNNDAFVEPDMLDALVTTLEADAGIGAACPRIVLAPRFSTLRISAPPWSPVDDGRTLGVRIEGLRVDGRDVFGDAVFGSGCHGPEEGARGPFRWSSNESLVHVPVSDTGGAAGWSVRLSCPHEAKIGIDGGGGKVVATVDPTGAWVDVTGEGPVYDIVNNVGSMLVEGGYGGDRGFLQPDLGQFDEPEDVFAWCGAGVLFRPDYLQQTGLFDERFFMYYEDTDLAWRGQALGWRYRYVPEAKMRHVHAATSVEGSPLFRFWVDRNRLFMLTKNAPAPLALRAVGGLVGSIATALVRDGLRRLLAGHRPSLGQARTRAKSLVSYGSMLPAMLRERRRLRRRQVVPDEAILAWAVPR